MSRYNHCYRVAETVRILPLRTGTVTRDENCRKVSGKFPETLGSETLCLETFPSAVRPFYSALNDKFCNFLILRRCDLFIQ
jgi:hypothetical protein